MSEAYVGQVELEATLTTLLLTRPATLVPTNADATPTARVFRDSTPLTVVPTIAFRQNGSVTAGTGNGVSPIVLTSAAHGLAVGQVVTVSGATGNTNANGTKVITAVTTDTFTFAGTGNGTFGGTCIWNTTGLYKATLACTAANGFVAGQLYQILFNYAVAGTQFAQQQNFLVR